LTPLPPALPSGECRFAYGDTQPAASLAGSVAYNQDTIENPAGGKLWLMATIVTIEYVVPCTAVASVHTGTLLNNNVALVNVLDILVFFYADRLNYTLLFGIPILYFCSILGYPAGGKLWLMATIVTIEYVVHEF
jgi:hypothetical protein